MTWEREWRTVHGHQNLNLKWLNPQAPYQCERDPGRGVVWRGLGLSCEGEKVPRGTTVVATGESGS